MTTPDLTPPDPRNAPEPRYAELIARIAQELGGHQSEIVILSHVDPDGDALGSCLGLQRALRLIGRQAQTYMKVPQYLEFLPSDGEVLPELQSWPEHALLVVLDVDNNDARPVKLLRSAPATRRASLLSTSNTTSRACSGQLCSSGSTSPSEGRNSRY